MRSWATSCGVRRTLYRHAGPRTEVLGREPRTCVRLAARRAAARCRQRQSRVRASDWAQDDSRLVGAKDPCLSHRTRSRAAGTASIGSWRAVRPTNLPPASLSNEWMCSHSPLLTGITESRVPRRASATMRPKPAPGRCPSGVFRMPAPHGSRRRRPARSAMGLDRGDALRVGYGILCRSLPRVVCSVAAEPATIGYRRRHRESCCARRRRPLPRGRGRRTVRKSSPRPCHP